LPETEKSPAPSILLVGTLHGRKRGDLLRRAFHEQIRPAIPNAELWGVCDAPDDARDPEESGEHWFGRVPLEQLRDLYRRAWVFCLPSSYEGFGVPYIEAMASGTAVVSTPNVGAIEVTRNGKDGLLCKDDELGQSLIKVLQDDSLRSSLRTAGLKRVQHFSWERVCAQYIALYEGKSPKINGVKKPAPSNEVISEIP